MGLKEIKYLGMALMLLAFVSGIAFLIKFILSGSLPTLVISIGSIFAGFGFVSVLREE